MQGGGWYFPHGSGRMLATDGARMRERRTNARLRRERERERRVVARVSRRVGVSIHRRRTADAAAAAAALCSGEALITPRTREKLHDAVAADARING